MIEQQQRENRALIAEDVQVVELENGIQFGDQTIVKITVRKPNTQALMGVKLTDLFQGDVNAVLTVIPRVTTPMITKAHFPDLEPSDIAQFGGALLYFLQPKSVRRELSQQQ